MHRIYFGLMAIPLFIFGCKVDIDVGEGGEVVTSSGEHYCPEFQTCEVQVSDAKFNETFTAVPKDGFRFLEWESKSGSLCGYQTEPCQIDTTPFAGNSEIEDIIAEAFTVKLTPRWETIGAQWSSIPEDPLIVKEIREDKVIEILGEKNSEGLWQTISQIVVADAAGTRTAVLDDTGRVRAYADENGNNYYLRWISENKATLRLVYTGEDGVRSEQEQVILLPGYTEGEAQIASDTKSESELRSGAKTLTAEVVSSSLSIPENVPVSLRIKQCGGKTKLGDDAFDVEFEVQRESGKFGLYKPVFDAQSRRWTRNMFGGIPLSEAESTYLKFCRLDNNIQVFNDDVCDIADTVELMCLQGSAATLGALAPLCAGLEIAVTPVGLGCGIPGLSVSCAINLGTVYKDAAQNILKIRAVATPRRSLAAPFRTRWRQWDTFRKQPNFLINLGTTQVTTLNTPEILNVGESYSVSVPLDCSDVGGEAWLSVFRGPTAQTPKNEWEQVYLQKRIADVSGRIQFSVPGASSEFAVDEINVYLSNPNKLAQKPAAKKTLFYQVEDLGDEGTDFSGRYTILVRDTQDSCGDFNSGGTTVSMIRVDSSTYTMTIAGVVLKFDLDKSGKLKLNQSIDYLEDGGTTSGQFSVTVTPAGELSGSEKWRWSGGGGSCSGLTEITGTKVS